MVIRDIDQQRLSRLEGTYEQVDRRLNDMNSRLDSMQHAIDGMHRAIEGLRAEMNSRFEEMNSRYNTLIVVMVASWATLMAALITTLFLK